MHDGNHWGSLGVPGNNWGKNPLQNIAPREGRGSVGKKRNIEKGNSKLGVS